jgi:TetR/AcrR family transcriptional repressor of tetCD
VTGNSRRQDNAAATEQALIQAAHSLFSKQGFNHTSIDSIAQQARVSKGAFYHHFKTKKHMFVACYEQQAAQVAHAISIKPTQDPWADAQNQCQIFLDFIIQQKTSSMPLQEAITVLGFDTWKKIDSNYTMGIILKALTRLEDHNLIKPYKTQLVAETLYGILVNAAISSAGAKQKKQTYKQLGDMITGFLNSLRA